jgi:hypothetical protein
VKSRPVFIDAAANAICATIFRADEQLVSRVLPKDRTVNGTCATVWRPMWRG